MTTDTGPGAPASARVWDLPLRLFHWVLAVTVGGSWLTAELGVEYREYHFWCGYTVLGLVVFRLVWGLCGSRYARFTSFLRGPHAIRAYVSGLRGGPSAPLYPGHNPLGALAVVAMLAVLLLQATTGLFADDDILYTGPYRDAVSSALAGDLTDLHHTNFKVLLTLLGLHVVAIAYYQWLRREPLLGAMLHGRKPLPSMGTHPALTSSWWVRGLLVALVAAAAVWLLLYMAPEPVYDDYYY